MKDAPLYQDQRRFGILPAEAAASLPGHRIPAPEGHYRVTLHFVDISYNSYHRRFEGTPAFDIMIEKELVPEDCRPSKYGFATAFEKSFEFTVRDRFLDLELVRRVDNPMIAAIELRALD